MPIIVSMKHGDIVRHDSMIDALFDYMDSIEARGVFMQWEEPTKEKTMGIKLDLNYILAHSCSNPALDGDDTPAMIRDQNWREFTIDTHCLRFTVIARQIETESTEPEDLRFEIHSYEITDI